MKTIVVMSQITLLTLPSELIEAILVSSCSPRTVSSAAQTCQTLRTLVYASPDSHLWRELFLTTWDDPRPALEHRALVDPRIDPAAWDWGTEYRRRVSADRRLKAWRRNICPADDKAGRDADVTGLGWHTTALSALSAVLDTLLTLRPFPATPPMALTVVTPFTPISPFPAGNVGSSLGGRWESTGTGMTPSARSAPPLPPLLIVLASGISAFEASRSGARVGRMVYGPHASRVLGDKAARERAPMPMPIPTPSLPPQLVRTLLASHAVGVRGLPTYPPSLSGTDHWGGGALGDVFHWIICITGFVPIPPPLVSDCTWTPCMSTTTSESVSDHARSASAELKDDEFGTREDGEQHGKNDHGESDERSARQIPKEFPSPLEQHADARILARRRVYDMRYLRGDRLWGPFQPVTRESLGPRLGASRLDDDGKGKPREGGKHASARGAASGRHGGGTHRLGTLAWSMGVDIEPDVFDSTSASDDSEDEDWHDPADPGRGFPAGREQTTGDEDMADADTDAEMEHPLISLILASTVNGDTANIEPITNPTSTASRRRTRRSNPRLPSNSLVSPREIRSQHLRPDYVYLASARIVVEANLRELLGGEIGGDVEEAASECEVTAGEVGMFWEDEEEILRARGGSSEPGTLSTPSPWFSRVMPDPLLLSFLLFVVTYCDTERHPRGRQ